MLSFHNLSVDTPPPEQKAQWLENENEAKSRCQRRRQKVCQWLRHGHAIGIRQSLSRALFLQYQIRELWPRSKMKILEMTSELGISVRVTSNREAGNFSINMDVQACREKI